MLSHVQYVQYVQYVVPMESPCFQLFPTVPTSQAEEKKSSEVLAARRAKGLAAHSGRKVGIP
jgi:hypothetical protein